MNFDIVKAREWAKKDAALGETRDYLLAALNQIDRLQLQRMRARQTILDLAGPRKECHGAHETGEILWPGTAHQGVICFRCKVFLPC